MAAMARYFVASSRNRMSVSSKIKVTEQSEIHHTGRIWILRPVPSFPYARVVVGVLVFALLLAGYWAAGVLVRSEHPEISPSAAVFFCAILGYIVPVFHYIVTRSAVAFDDLSPLLDAEAREVSAWRRSISEKSVRWTATTLACGILAGVIHNSARLGSPVVLVQAMSTSLEELVVAIGVILVWVVMTTVITSLIENAYLFGRLAVRTRFDLYNTSTLTPFARVAVISTLALIGAQASFSILWLSPGVDAIDFMPGLVATAVPMVVIFVLPIWQIHRALAQAKHTELERINAAIQAVPMVDPGDADSLARINPLLVYRREVRQIHAWPFDMSVVMRLALYLFIVPLTWVAAALIENVVEAFL